MYILLVNYEYKPQCGGAGFAVYNLAVEMNRQGHRVELLIGWDDRFGKPEIIQGVRTYVVGLRKKSVHESSPAGILGYLCRGMPLLAQLTKRNHYDAVQFFFSIPTGILKYGIHNKIPYVCSLRGIDVPSARADKYAFLRNILKWVNKDIVKNASAVTALSSELAGWFHETYPQIPVWIIPNGIDCSRFRKKTNYRKKITKFVTVARLIKCKNIELSVRAFKKVHKRHPDITLDIIGEGYLHERIEKTIQSEKMSGYVRLKGYMDPAEIAEKLCEYDVFYLLTTADAFGQVFIEAMACGLPVICADIGGPKEIVIDGVTGIKVVPDDEKSTQEALLYAVRHSEKMQEYGEHGYQRVIQQYSIQAAVKKHIELYQRLQKGVSYGDIS